VSNELEILQEFPFTGRHEWLRRLQAWHFDGPQLRLDWLVHLGGPLRIRLEEILSANPEIRFSVAMRSDPVLDFEIRHRLERLNAQNSSGARRMLYVEPEAADADFQAWNIRFQDIAVVLRNSRATNEEVIPLESFLRKVVGKVMEKRSDSSQLEDAARVFREVWREHASRETPWGALRLWLREGRNKEYAQFPVQREIERLISYLSPQDEVAELESLTAGQLMVNPTLEVLTNPFDRVTPLLAIARFRGDLIEREIGKAEAALIEVIREDFRADEGRVVVTASNESRVATDEISRALQRLKLEGIVLSSGV
jgi:hypothetical protein